MAMKGSTLKPIVRGSLIGAALLLAAWVAPLALSSSAEAAGKPRIGGTLKLGNAKGIGTPIPFVAFTSIPEYIKNNMYEPLVNYDQKGDIHPWLAESWTPNADSSEWTFKIRKGVKFHNGKELTAEDVVWSARHIMDPANGAAGQGQLADNVAEATAVGQIHGEVQVARAPRPVARDTGQHFDPPHRPGRVPRARPAEDGRRRASVGYRPVQVQVLDPRTGAARAPS